MCIRDRDTTASETEEAKEEIESDEESLHVLSKTFEDDTSLAVNKINYGNRSTM